jgi:hypothetical protein
MPVRYLLSSAYFPPIDYLSLINKADNILIENEENYLKQTFRNRCIILTANGVCALTVPVLSGKLNKTPIKDTRIDYSKRWQQVHLRALISSYKMSPYFDYYFDEIEKLISSKPEYLTELNLNSINIILKITGISANISLTETFEPVTGLEYDFRYSISPKKERPGISSFKEYYQVFNSKYGFVPGLSSLDLIFNMGPDSRSYLTI